MAHTAQAKGAATTTTFATRMKGQIAEIASEENALLARNAPTGRRLIVIRKSPAATAVHAQYQRATYLRDAGRKQMQTVS